MSRLAHLHEVLGGPQALALQVHVLEGLGVETIDFQSGPDALTAAMGAGTAPDVLFDAPGRIIEYGNGGYLVPLDDMLDALKSDLTSESLIQTWVAEPPPCPPPEQAARERAMARVSKSASSRFLFNGISS